VPDEHDYSSDVPPRPRRRENFEPDDRDDVYARRDVPKLVSTAGIIWIVFGSILLINAVVNLGLSGATVRAGENPSGGPCGGIVGIGFGIAFVFVGMQSVKGTAKDTLGNGIGSIIIGALYATGGAVVLVLGLGMYALISQGKATAPNADQAALIVTVTGGVLLVSGLGLILAGTLALMGRADYKEYRRAGKRSAPIDD
jgi:hypothetical protein